jgi:hypothetical protein
MARVYVACDDLFFRVKLGAALQAMGEETGVAPDEADVAIVDLDLRREDPIARIGMLKEHGVKVLAFAPHVERDKRRAAQAAGADLVAFRSQIAEDLPGLLGRLAIVTAGSDPPAA